MSFGLLLTQTHIMHCPLIGYIQTILGYLGTTSGRGLKYWSLKMGARMQKKLINSVLSVFSMLKAADLCFYSGLLLCLAGVG